MSRRSLRIRIVVLLLTAHAIIAACCILGTLLYMRRQVRAAFDSELISRMTATLAQIHPAEEKLGGIDFDEQQPATRQSGDLFFVEASNGSRVAGSSTWITVAQNSKRDKHGLDFWWQGQHYRGAAWINIRVPDQEDQSPRASLNVSVYYAMPTTRGDQALVHVAEIAALIAIGVLVLSWFAALWAVSSGLRPLVRLADEAGHIDVDRWSFQADATAFETPELASLAQSLTHLVDRLKAAFERERQFVGDAAHELKTTVAIQKSTLQLADRENLPAAEYRDAITVALEDTARTEALIASMLQLARLEGIEAISVEKAAVSQLRSSLIPAIAEFKSWSALTKVSISLHGDPDVNVRGRADELLMIWRNLIENAIQHSPPNSTIQISVASLPECVQVIVQDNGDGISPKDLPHIFERFFRTDTSRSRLSGGFGLGLSIAKRLVEQLGGTIDITSSSESGTRAKVCLQRSLHPAELMQWLQKSAIDKI